MNTKLWVGAVALIVIVAGVVWFTKTPAASQATAASQGKQVFVWGIKTLPESDGTPRTSVSLTVGEKTYPMGEFDGSCSEIDGTSWDLYDGEKTGVICWWAGGGNEIGIFEEGGQTVVKQGELDEGSAETQGFRGNFKTILTIN